MDWLEKEVVIITKQFIICKHFQSDFSVGQLTNKENVGAYSSSLLCVIITYVITCPFSNYFQIFCILAKFFKHFAHFLKKSRPCPYFLEETPNVRNTTDNQLCASFKNVWDTQQYYHNMLHVFAKVRKCGPYTFFLTCCAAEIIQVVARQYGEQLSDDQIQNLSLNEKLKT